MIRANTLGKIKPEEAQCCQDFSFVGYACRQHYIKTGYSVGRYDQKFILQVIDIPDLASAKERDVLKIGFQKNVFCSHGFTPFSFSLGAVLKIDTPAIILSEDRL